VIKELAYICNVFFFSDVIAQHSFYCPMSLSAMLRMSGALAKSTDVMKTMNHLVRVPEIQATMRELSKEMTKVQCLIVIITS